MTSTFTFTQDLDINAPLDVVYPLCQSTAFIKSACSSIQHISPSTAYPRQLDIICIGNRKATLEYISVGHPFKLSFVLRNFPLSNSSKIICVLRFSSQKNTTHVRCDISVCFHTKISILFYLFKKLSIDYHLHKAIKKVRNHIRKELELNYLNPPLHLFDGSFDPPVLEK